MIFLAIFVAVPFLYNVTSAKQFQVLGYATNVTVSDLHSISNQERGNNGVAPLNLDSSLNSAAQAKANDMIEKNYWAHVSPDGTTPWAFISAAGYQYTVAGENLAKDFSQSSGVVAGWMASPAHRDNIVNSAYRDVGYAVVNGVLQGSETTLVVAMYGARAAPPPPAPAPTQAPAPQPPAAPQPTPAAPVEQTPAAEPAKSDETPMKSKNKDTAKSQAATTNAQDSGSVAGLAASLPVRTYSSFNWGQKVSLLLVSTLILLFIMKHTLIWREQKRGFRHIWLRAHPLGQATMLTSMLVIIVLSGAGVVL